MQKLKNKFSKKLSDIITYNNLLDAYNTINKNSIGLDEISFIEFEQNLHTNLKELANDILLGTYAPEPLKNIEIDKPNSNEKRPISISSIKDKIIQQLLYQQLNPFIDSILSDKSYAYRENKSTLKAINRVSNYINQKYHWIAKTDIDNFFDSIDHNILISKLQELIADNQLIKLLVLFLDIGSFKGYDYLQHNLGVHQGDILSPMLSNIYLDSMDKYLEQQNIAFVRYADDFVMLFKKEKEAKSTLANLKIYLKSLNLTLEESKTYITHINDGFTFLGITYKGKYKSIQNERFQKTISKLYKLSKKSIPFYQYITNLNSYLLALKNYYLKIIQNNQTQLDMLKNALIDSISQKIYLSRTSKEIKTKKEFRLLLEKIKLSILFTQDPKDIQELILAKGIEKYLANKTYNQDTKINKQKNKYSKKFALQSTLHINKKGVMLGISKNKFVLKEYGRVKTTYPLDKIKRIIFEGKGFSLSSNVIKKCAQNNISIDFIDNKYYPYASLITYNATTTHTIHKQAMLLNTPKQLYLAKAFIKSKAKNQLNYIKYLNKYHANLQDHIQTIQKHIPKIKKATSINQLMGIEGTISTIYWDAIRAILDIDFPRRITLGAKDIVNSSLNYAYAILYGKVQESLVLAGLSLNISFLHSLDKQKPTLTFDAIEQFRSFIVDRVIISMLNKDEPIKLDKKGLLTKKSRQLIAKNIYEKLGSYTNYKKESKKIENIIYQKAYELASYINQNSKSFKPFIGKY
jgi:group II intron reverse transcriptase/maturase/CRISPR-associated endonuclease Cas1